MCFKGILSAHSLPSTIHVWCKIMPTCVVGKARCNIDARQQRASGLQVRPRHSYVPSAADKASQRSKRATSPRLRSQHAAQKPSGRRMLANNLFEHMEAHTQEEKHTQHSRSGVTQGTQLLSHSSLLTTARYPP